MSHYTNFCQLHERGSVRRAGADPALRDFERDYYPATADHYRDQF